MKTLLDGCRFQDLINAWRVRLEAKLTCRWARARWVLAKMSATFLKLEPAKEIKFVRDLLRSLGRAPLAPGFSVDFLPGGQNFPAKNRLLTSLLPGIPFGFQGKFPEPFLKIPEESHAGRDHPGCRACQPPRFL